jgi:2-methylcitrate dehydratase PrpD
LLEVRPSITGEIAAFVADARLREVDDEVRHLAKRSIIDGIGLALAGSVSECARISGDYLAAMGLPGDRGAAVIGTSLRVPARFAAFANGMAIHADDYDDTQLAVAKDRVYGLLTHPTAPALPPVLALAECHERSGAEVLTAYLVAVEVECKVAEAIAPRHYQQGFHSTGTCGAIGAAAGAAKVLRLDAEATRRALALGATQAAGLRENFGTMTKPFHAGRAAESGVVAAELASRGFTASPIGLEADRGFFRAAGGGYAADAILGRLGNPWTFASPGISIKPHPSGSLTHPGMAVMAELIREHGIRAADVERVTVGTNSNMPNALIHHRPANELQAKFSMEFCMAILLLEGRAGLEEFTDEVVERDDVRALIERVDFRVDPVAEAAGFDKMTTLVAIELRDGRRLEGRADFGKGSPANPMTDAELADKFHQCAAWGRVPRERAAAILERLWRLEDLPDLHDLAGRLLSSP